LSKCQNPKIASENANFGEFITKNGIALPKKGTQGAPTLFGTLSGSANALVLREGERSAPQTQKNV
jgi:hypothetical protein